MEKMEGYVDLHVHTSFSDSIYSPEEVLRRAKEAGLVAVGICDHDAVGGIERALALEDEYGVEVIPGVELSSELGNMEVHILGYYLDWTDARFRALLKTIQEVRVWRAELMVSKLQRLGINLELKEVLAESGTGSIGRPHIARVMVRHGYVGEIQEAFDKYLKYGGPAYVGKYEMTPEQAIAQIKKLCGIPVLAHMKFSEMTPPEFERLVKAGLRGLEVYHAKHTPEESQRYLELARKYDLLVTGGSDNHGEEDPIGCVKLPYGLVEQLKEERESILFLEDREHP
jgi:hypothetical protein